MRKVTAKIDDDAYKILKSSKILYDYIMQEHPDDIDWNVYVGLLLWLGIESIIKSVTPPDNPLLQQTLLQMHEKNPEFVSNFIVDTLKVGGEVQQQEARQKIIGFIKRQ